MASRKRDRWGFDESAALITGRIVPHRAGDGRWVIRTANDRFLPVQVHPSLLEQLEQNPERFEAAKQFFCWMRWNWEEGGLLLTAVQAFNPKPGRQDCYRLQGTVDKVGSTLAVIRITSRKEGVEPFEVPVTLREQQAAWLKPGCRASIQCTRARGWLQARYVRTQKPEAEELAAAG